MLVLYCQTCSLGCSCYRKWIAHLFSPAHQKKTKNIIKGWSKKHKRRAILFTEFCKPYQDIQEDEFTKLAWKVSEHTIISDLFFNCSTKQCIILIDKKKGAEFIVSTDDITASSGHYLHIRLAADIPSNEWDDIFKIEKKQLVAHQTENETLDTPEVEQEIKVEANKGGEHPDTLIRDGNQKDVTENNPFATTANNFEMENSEVSEFVHSMSMQIGKTENVNKPIKDIDSEANKASDFLEPTALTSSFVNTSTRNEINTPSTKPKTLLNSSWSIELNNCDLESLRTGNCLNENLIEFWLMYMKRDVLSSEDKERTYVFSPRFYSTLITEGPNESTKLKVSRRHHARVADWTKDDDIFSYDFLLVPIIEDSHWILVVICFPSLDGVYDLNTGDVIAKLKRKRRQQVKSKSGSSACNEKEVEHSSSNQKDDISVCGTSSPTCNKNSIGLIPTEDVRKSFENVSSPTKRPRILILDCCGEKSKTKIAFTLRHYLHVEYKVKKGIFRKFTSRTMPISEPYIPTDKKTCDSGICLLHFAESFIRNPIYQYKYPQMSELKRFFTPATLKRKYIYDCIVQLVKTENPENLEYIPHLIFSSEDSSSTSAFPTVDSMTTKNSPETSQANLSGNTEIRDENESTGPPASKRPRSGLMSFNRGKTRRSRRKGVFSLLRRGDLL